MAQGAGTQNEIGFAENFDFSGSNPPAEANGLQTNGQLWIGRTAVNAGGTHISVGNLTSPDASVTIGYSAPNITLTASGSMTTQTITPDVGAAVNPVAGTIGVKGSVGTLPTDSILTHNFGNPNVGIENRRWHTAFVVDPSATVGSRGTYATITAALAAASSGTTIFLRPGTYTENFTLKAGVNICGWPSDGASANFRQSEFTYNVKIVGKMSFSAAGSCCISNVFCQTNGDFIVAISGANSSHVLFENCYIYASNNTAISQTTSNGALSFFNCDGDIGAGGISYFAQTTGGGIAIEGGVWANSGASTTSSTWSAGTVTIRNCEWICPVTSSGTTSDGNFYNVWFNYAGSNTTMITHGSTSAVPTSMWDCFVLSGTASAISVGAGASLRVMNSKISSTNTNAITGSGTLIYSDLIFADLTGSTVSNVINTTTQLNLSTSSKRYRVTAPAAYPYTTLVNDEVIIVDTSAARTINLNASPLTGQTYRIKDNVGSAAANNITITPAAGNIDGAGSYAINTAYGSVDVVYNGTQWNLV